MPATVVPPTPPPEVLARLRRLRWSAFALLGAGYVLSFFHRIAPAAIAGELRQALGASGAELGALAATYFSVYTVMQVLTGVMVDALGPRRIAALGGLVAGLGSVAFGAAGGLGVASLGRALVGLGVSVSFIALLKLVAAWFREREFATLSGLVTCMGSLGAILSAAPLAWAVTRTSWRNVFLGIGLSSLGGAALTWLLVRDRPEDAGLPSMRDLDGLPPHPPHRGRWWEGLWLVMRNPATWPVFFVNMGLGGTYLAFAGLWAVPFLAEAHGMSRARATGHTTLMLVCFAFSSLVTGKLSDRLGRRRPLMLGLGLAYLLCWLPWLAGAHPRPWGSLALFGVMGASATGFTLSWASVKEVNPPSLSGTAMAVVNAGVFLGPTIYQPLVGWVLDRAAAARGAAGAAAARYAPEDFRWGLWVLAAFALMGFLAALLVRETYRRPAPVTPPAPPR